MDLFATTDPAADATEGHAVQRVLLRWPADLDGFRHACRRLVAAGVAPEQVDWRVDEEGAERPADAADALPPLRAPAVFVELCRDAIRHADDQRFARLYRWLWRLLHDPLLKLDALDADRLALERMARAVRRDAHKMTAFVRFRPVQAEGEGAPPLHVAWFEPAHHVVEAVAPFFVKRFANLHWVILTPRRSVRWNGQLLDFGPGARREDAPRADDGEALWLTYYRSIFNPARLKLAMMEKEMPRRYWGNLPEAVLIGPLAAAAAARTEAMVERAPAAPRRRIVKLVPKPVDDGHRAPDVDSLDGLAAGEQHCRDCPIGEHATQAVPGAGAPDAALMLVGEQPGDQEDLRGQPFVGPAGQLLDRAIERLGWQRDSLYVTNAVKHFKFELRGKRRLHKTPAQQEVAACVQWLEREVALVRPQGIVALGATAARALLGRPVPVLRERGQWFTRDDGVPVLVTLHPSALLRQQADDPEAEFERWLEDLHGADRLAPRR